GEDQSRIELAGAAAQAADDADLAADPDGAEGKRERVGAADFRHLVDAAAAIESDRRLVPFRRRLVVDAARGAERLGALKLVVARRRDDRDDAHRMGELQPED